MSYEINYSVDKNVWEEAVSKFKEANFLQSWSWGEFQKALNKKVFRFVVLEKNQVVGFAQMVKENAKRGVYITVAGGPILNWDKSLLFNFVFDEIKRLGKEEKVDFIRFRPQEINTSKRCSQVSKIGAVVSQMHLTADLTLQLDLSKSEEELLSQMRKNHRSSIKKSEKLGITVSFSRDENEIKSFYDKQLFLAQRHGFVPFPYDFLYEQFKAFSVDNNVLLVHARQADILLASAFVIFYNGEAVYHYGISTDENLKLPGSYACQWYAIKEAKRRGCLKYNFWGIAPQDIKEHRFSGVTMFKRGFGGEEIEYLHAHDIPLSKKYLFTSLFEFIRKKIRRL